jgi:hypothetical protein
MFGITPLSILSDVYSAVVAFFFVLLVYYKCIKSKRGLQLGKVETKKHFPV